MKRLNLTGTAILVATLVGHGAALAAAPAAIGEPRVATEFRLSQPACGTSEFPFGLTDSWWDEQGQKYHWAIETKFPDGEIKASAVLEEFDSSSSVTLICRNDGSGVVVGMSRSDQLYTSTYRIQSLDSAGRVAAALRTLTPESHCTLSPERWLLVGDKLVLVATCGKYPRNGQILLRSFPADGDPVPLPIEVKSSISYPIDAADAAADALGNIVVAWSEEHSCNEYYECDSRVHARVVNDGMKLVGSAFDLDTFVPRRARLLGVGSEADGIFSVYWESRFEGELVRLLSVDPDLYSFTSTTTTTLPPSDDAPEFSIVRTVGQTALPPKGPSIAEQGVSDMKGDGHGGLVLRRGIQRTMTFDPAYDADLPRASTYVSSTAGARWNSPPAPPLHNSFRHDSMGWDGVSRGGTTLFAQFVRKGVEAEEYYGEVGSIVVQRSTDQGVSWPTTAVIDTLSCSGCEVLRVDSVTLVSSNSGAWMAVVETTKKQDSSCSVSLDAAYSADDGKSWSASGHIYDHTRTGAGCSADDEQEFVTAASDPAGGWNVVWQREFGSELWFSRSAASGAAWNSRVLPQFASPGYGPLYRTLYGGYRAPSLVVAPSGTTMVGWESLPFVVVTRSEDHGQSWSAPESIGYRGGVEFQSPSLAADDGGRILAAWSAHLGAAAGTDSDIVASISTDDGRTFSPPSPVDPAALGDARQDLDPIVAADGDNRWTIAWNALPFTDRYDPVDTIVKVAVSGFPCDNGTVDAGEECDDGNDIDLDGCNANCTLPGCGNEVLEPGEQCEYGGSDPSCAATCEQERCGDGVINVFTEQCDDANPDDSDECPSLCFRSYCGDGFVRFGTEECDDANSADNDACRNSCKLAYCGDGILEKGVELCDDGDRWSGNACTEECRTAVCGDGYVRVGVEQCDDPTGENLHGACSVDCKLAERCGDADDSGTTTATDALKILRFAVDLEPQCTRDRCDIDGNGLTTASDASAALHDAAGLGVTLRCPIKGSVRFVLMDSPVLGSLEVAVDPTDAGFEFGHVGRNAECESLLPNVLFGAGYPYSPLRMGFVTFQGFRGPSQLARCTTYAPRGATGPTGPVDIDVEATDLNLQKVEPAPSVAMLSD